MPLLVVGKVLCLLCSISILLSCERFVVGNVTVLMKALALLGPSLWTALIGRLGGKWLLTLEAISVLLSWMLVSNGTRGSCSVLAVLALQVIVCSFECSMAIGTVRFGLASSSTAVRCVLVVIIRFTMLWLLIMVRFGVTLLLWLMLSSKWRWKGLRLTLTSLVSWFLRVQCLWVLSSLCSCVPRLVMVVKWLRCVLVSSSDRCSCLPLETRLWWLLIVLWVVCVVCVGAVVRWQSGLVSVVIRECSALRVLAWRLTITSIIVSSSYVVICSALRFLGAKRVGVLLGPVVTLLRSFVLVTYGWFAFVLCMLGLWGGSGMWCWDVGGYWDYLAEKNLELRRLTSLSVWLLLWVM